VVTEAFCETLDDSDHHVYTSRCLEESLTRNITSKIAGRNSSKSKSRNSRISRNMGVRKRWDGEENRTD